MKQTINLHKFREGFKVRNESFSYKGLRALFDFLEELEENEGVEYEFNPVELAGCYEEFENVHDFLKQYDYVSEDIKENCEDEDDLREALIDYVMKHSCFIDVDGEAFITMKF